MSGTAPLAEGERVLLRRREGDTFLLKLANGPMAVEGRGVVDLGEVIGQPPGRTVRWAGSEYRVLRPSLSDLIGHLRRKAQIVTPKDSAQLVAMAGIAPGDRVAEAGAGSGALTVVLAYTVGAEGRVYSFDRRAEFLDVARRNVGLTGLESRVEFQERDVGEDGFPQRELDAILLDVPEPWSVAGHALSALRPGGYLATYTPTYNQLERTVKALRAARFEEVRSVEILERSLHVGEGGTRPEFDMLGHTAFLTAARRVE
ncbi:MAG: tRNA (adenine-N1)-methyltransferase [Thermoplasmata archaeon]|nr:tRNA (adenine-N1)-methyltransferase [Thermoplasmata archaeon]